MKDERLYAKFTLDFPDSAKILPLSVEAKWALVEMTIYSRRMLTDGFLARGLALAKWGLDVCSELASNDPIKPSLIEVENGYQIHDFAEHQSTKAEIEALTEKRRAAGRKGGQASAQAKAKQKPSKSNPETETETETETYKPPPKGGGAPRKRGCRLPDNWMPAQPVIDAMKAERPDVDLEAEHLKFVDYWTAKSGKDAVKLDWDATWRNWIRNARPSPQSRAAPVSTTDARIAAAQALKDQPATVHHLRGLQA